MTDCLDGLYKGQEAAVAGIAFWGEDEVLRNRSRALSSIDILCRVRGFVASASWTARVLPAEASLVLLLSRSLACVGCARVGCWEFVASASWTARVLPAEAFPCSVLSVCVRGV